MSASSRLLRPVVLWVLVGLVALCPPATVPAAPAAQDPVEVVDIDSYDRSFAPGANGTFRWTLRNMDPLNLTYRILLSVTGAPAGWSATFSDGVIEALGYRESVTITLALLAPSDDRRPANVSVVVEVYDGAALIQVTTRHVHVSIEAAGDGATEQDVLDQPWIGNPLRPYGAFWGTDVGVFLQDLLLWLLISIVVVFAFDALRRGVLRSEAKGDDRAMAILRTPVILILFSFGLVQSLETVGRYIDPGVLDGVRRTHLFIVSVAGFWIAYRVFKDLIIHYGKILAKKTASRVDDVLIPIVEKVGVIAIGFAFLAFVLGIFNIDLSLFVAGGVVASMVVAFAAQDTLSNLFAGFFLLLDRPFVEGDVIRLEDGHQYEVRKVGLRSTRLWRWRDATIVTIPNNKLVNQSVANETTEERSGRTFLYINVAYGSDLRKVKKIIAEVFSKFEEIEKEPSPKVRVDKLTENEVVIKANFWIESNTSWGGISDQVLQEIHDRFMEAGVEIPFAQRTIWLRQAEAGTTHPIFGKGKTATGTADRSDDRTERIG